MDLDAEELRVAKSLADAVIDAVSDWATENKVNLASPRFVRITPVVFEEIAAALKRVGRAKVVVEIPREE